MPIRERTASAGRASTRRQSDVVISDADLARRATGLSQEDLARATGMSSSQIGRLLRGEVRFPTTDQLGRLCAATGLRLVLRAYPAGDPIRDAAHVALLARLAAELPERLRWRTEVPIPIAGDLRAWDGTIHVDGDTVGVEAETRLGDIQAMQRRIALKQRDGGLERVVLLIADTRANHRAFAAAEVAIRSQFPLGPRATLAGLRAGRLPAASAHVFL
jgi:transcriptional regulator with XRE-family HTH domain